MNKLVTQGIICLKDDYNFLYKVADIEYVEYENGEFSYYFYPYYNVIDVLNPYLFQGIPGLDLSKRLKCYERRNVTPVFISERTPSENREDLWEHLDKYNMKSLNRLEWLIKTDTRYSGDRLYVQEKRDIDNNSTINVDSMFNIVKRSDSINRALLDIICYGNYLKCKEIIIDDNNRKYYYDLLMPIYIKEYTLRKYQIMNGIKDAKEKDIYKGRKKIVLDPLLFRKVGQEYLNGNVSLEAALNKLKISRSTFFRRLEDLR